MKALWTTLPSYKKKLAKQASVKANQKQQSVQAKRREPKKRISFVSSNQAVLKRQYNKLLDLLYGNPRKAKCGVQGCLSVMDDNHHTFGTAGTLYLDARLFVPACRSCHNIAKDDPERARQMTGVNPQGKMIPFLCEKGQWNHSPF